MAKRARPETPDPKIFIDQSARATALVDALRALKLDVAVNEDIGLAQDAEDTAVIPAAHVAGRIIFSKDHRTRYKPAERAAYVSVGAAAFILTTSKDVSAVEVAGAFVAALPDIKKLCAKYTRPLIATVTRSGALTVLVGTKRARVKQEK